VAYAIAMDALSHDGPANKTRVPATTCLEQLMPGIDPATFPQGYAAGVTRMNQELSDTSIFTDAEPELACYVFAACRLASSVSNAPVAQGPQQNLTPNAPQPTHPATGGESRLPIAAVLVGLSVLLRRTLRRTFNDAR
jgi:hypothetical protein